MRLLILTLLIPLITCAGEPQILSGPFQGHTSPREMKIWFLAKDTDNVRYELVNDGDSSEFHSGKATALPGMCRKNECPFKLHIKDLKEAANYTLNLYVGDVALCSEAVSTIRNYEVDEFSFLVGSCAFIGTGKDRFYKLWNSTRMFNTLAEEQEGDFMLWMGDNVYLMGNEIKSRDKTVKRYNKVRQHPKLNRFMKTRFHYSIWDDHDFGPNNSDGTFEQKEKSKEIFDNYWCNPNEPFSDGIYYNFSYGDIEIFMLDDRFNRMDGLDPKVMLGDKQLAWLKEQLKKSTATFKLIVSGNQVLNQYDDHESFMQYEKERDDLFGFIKEEQINGVVFFSGDRHHSEVLKRQMPGTYPFYDITCSALSSWRYPWRKMFKEGKNELRQGELILKHNYAVVSISGIQHNRILTVTFKDKSRKVLREFSLKEQQISF